MQDKLIDKQYWDEYWNGIALPQEVKRDNRSPNIVAELDIFERLLPKKSCRYWKLEGHPDSI